MGKQINKQWISSLSEIDYAFQPIVNIHTGNAFGFEALLRNHQKAGFDTIDDLFDKAYSQGLLHQVDLHLREKAVTKFSRFKKQSNIKLFYNLDNRLLEANDYRPGSTAKMLEQYGYSQDDFCFEISEKQKFQNNIQASKIISTYRSQGYKIAVDDCGTGFSGWQVLYYAEPDYVKIDRFFIQNLENDPKKRLVVSTIVNFAHFMGSLVLAEGVETRDEFFLCKEMGCDMVQGYYIEKPRQDLIALKPRYDEIDKISKLEKRNRSSKDRDLISSQIKYIQPMISGCDINTAFDKFRNASGPLFFPVINTHGEPVGVIRETAFKEYIYSKFGRALLQNPSFGKDISRFVSKIPIADIHSSVEKLIEIYAHYNNNEGLIMVDNMKYVGILSTQSLLKIINEKNLTLARNQNPLTRLPGNTLIHEYLSECLSDYSSKYHLVYFDFDHFKPFNDKYGFRNGDRLILMFSDLLKKNSISDHRFIGHVGGDDFFLGVKGADRYRLMEELSGVARTFKKNAESFYDESIIRRGAMTGKDREGNTREFPLISVSTAVLELPENIDRACSVEDASNLIALLKKEAKASDTRVAFAGIMDFLCKEDHPQKGDCFSFESYPDQCLRLKAEAI